MSSDRFSHLDGAGQAHMVDVSQREISTRTADASGKVLLSPHVVALLRSDEIPKGDVLAAARIAGIMGAKRTVDLIPLCHPIALSGITLDAKITDGGVELSAHVKTTDRTGVEMEALTAISIAALTVVDMVKSLDPGARISSIQIEAKDGGRNGSWKRQ